MRGSTILIGWLERLRRSQSGAAAVEFALILPIMLATYVGALEACTMITMDRKVQLVASAVGDLVARAEKRIPASDMEDYFRAASGIMTPYSSANVTQVVTVVQVHADRSNEVLWTRQYQDGDYSSTSPHSVGDAFNLPDEMTDISLGDIVIAAEASTTYSPLGVVFNTPVNLYRSSFFLPRFRRMVEIE